MRSLLAILIALIPMALSAVAQEVTEAVATTDSSQYPLLILVVGIVSVLGLIIGFRMNAFLALIIAALIISLMIVGDDGFDMAEAGVRMHAVVSAFGDSAGGVGIVIAMAAIIGKCMLDSGAADRVVRTAVRITGIEKASVGLMVSGFVLAVPVFFDTVFYLLVPLARSLFKRTNRNYLRYLMAIATGGAITHTLVPPTPGPLLVGANLGIDIGTMMWVGTLVAIPAAIVGLLFSIFVDRFMPVPMRPLGPGEEKHETLRDDQLPSLALSLLPIILPVVLIGMGTLATTLADKEDRGRLVASDLLAPEELRTELRADYQSDAPSPGRQLLDSAVLSEDQRSFLMAEGPVSEVDRQRMADILNEVFLAKDFYSEGAYLGIAISDVAKSQLSADQVRLKPVLRRRMNRALLEDAFPTLIKPHEWNSPSRLWANRLSLWSNANFALLLAALCAIATLKVVRNLTLKDLGSEVEEALMSGGMIILITAAGGAFGAMLKDAQVGTAIQGLFAGSSGGGINLLLLAFTIAAVLKVAQGSSTVSMIVASGMVAGIVTGQDLGYHPVYLATAVGSGSLMGSWMNDSGFWVFAKMGGLTEGEALRSWTLLLAVLSLTGLVSTIVLSIILPMAS
ncbi:Gnt-II system L-idonate transporter [Roseimaritima multifibrata]|uniref:Gnt-II system L-idonate transporter n=1 Tax=Roseimaritima multifibrata TaxID=1930274 RepID=A0A517MDB0_9BACT|nr:SLC13 family permease [Roseimaritima multifibrata]QDS92883.1 Gnt-II system L-idonate transporter [Roseimaritima multifibrata]